MHVNGWTLVDVTVDLDNRGDRMIISELKSSSPFFEWERIWGIKTPETIEELVIFVDELASAMEALSTFGFSVELDFWDFLTLDDAPVLMIRRSDEE